MESGTTTSRRMSGAEIRRRVNLILGAILVTLLIVFLILNYQRSAKINFLVTDVSTRVVWALLVPFVIGLVLGWLTGRVKIRR